MSMKQTIVPKSDQLNADDLLTGPMRITVERVEVKTGDQPVSIFNKQIPKRPYKPSKSMRRVLVTCWGDDETRYVGREMDLYRDPDLTFGGVKTGGIRISHLTEIEKPTEVTLTVKKGKKEIFTVYPFGDDRHPLDGDKKYLSEVVRDPLAPTAAVTDLTPIKIELTEAAACGSDAFRAAWKRLAKPLTDEQKSALDYKMEDWKKSASDADAAANEPANEPE
jgi:hypothetical protein